MTELCLDCAHVQSVHGYEEGEEACKVFTCSCSSFLSKDDINCTCQHSRKSHICSECECKTYEKQDDSQ